MYKLIGLYLLIVVGIFIQFGFLGSVGAVIVKVILLAGISYLMYNYWIAEQGDQLPGDETEKETVQKIVAREEKKSPVFDISSASLSEILELDNQYKEFLKNQFMIIWNFLYPKNGFIIYRNLKDKIRIVYEHQQIEAPVQINQYPTSLFTLIENKDGILIENKIEQSSKLFPFYQMTDYKPQSLLAFICELESGEKLYWIYDSDILENFNTEDTASVERVIENINTITIETLKSNAVNKYNKFIESKFQIAEKLNMAANTDECLDFFCDFLINNFEASKLTIGLRENSEAQSAIIKKAIGTDDPYKAGFEFSLEEGLNGFVIMKNKPHLIDDIEKGEYFVPRFSKEEKTNYGLHSYLSVPIEIENIAIGMISLEDKLVNKFSLHDKNNLINYSKILANALYRFEKTKIHKN